MGPIWDRQDPGVPHVGPMNFDIWVVPLFCLTVGGNLWQCQYKTPENIYKTSRDPLTNFYGQSLLLFWPGRPSFSGVLISPIAIKAVRCICVDHILGAVSIRKTVLPGMAIPMISREESLKPFGIFTESFGNVTDMVTEEIFVGKYSRKKKKNEKKSMYKINWYIKSYVQDTVQRMWVTNLFAKYSNVNDEKKISGLKGLSWDFMTNIHHRTIISDFS